MTSERYLADFSLALINRTGAYHVCHDILAALPEHFAATRYWRSTLRREPTGLIRRVRAKLMMFELTRLRAERISRDRPAAVRAPILFLDPLYVIGSNLDRRDIVLCHDVGPITDAHLFDAKTHELYQTAYARIAAAKPGMVFVSEASRQAFVALYGADFRFLEVIPLYVRAGSENGPERRPAGVETPFLLTVGALETRKNHARVIEAFQRADLRAKGYSYVFCGPRGNEAARITALAQATDGVQGLGFLDDAEMRWLYRHASGFVLPSLMEGFGLPALEAARHGLVALVSQSGAQAEAVGDGALQVDPLDVDSIADGLRRLVEMPEVERAERLARTRAHADSLSFERYVDSWGRLLRGAWSIA